jgi:SNF2 family DNA or RNA helicase
MYEIGQKLRIRNRLWEVREARPQEYVTLLKVSGFEADNKTQERTFIDKAEQIELIKPAKLKWHIGQPSLWKALHDAFFLSMHHGSEKLLSLERGRVTIEEYQLDPVIKALSLPRQRLLIADDVGLGKTIEAGLILMELLARGRADRILIVTPASLQDQWADEMFDKFGLEFDIFDSTRVAELQGYLPRGANPWSYKNRIITSIDYVKRDDIKRALRNICWHLVIIDEAHYLAEGGFGSEIQRTERSRFGEFIADANRSDSLILLTATPHNGYSRSFYSLIRLLDKFILPEEGKIEKSQIEPVLVRRIKGEVDNADGTKRFKSRKVNPIEVKFASEAESDLYSAVVKYCERQWKQAQKEAGKEAVGFAMTVLKKRMLSCLEALKISLANRLNNLSTEIIDINVKRGLIADYKAGVPLTETQLERVENDLLTCPLDPKEVEAEKKVLERLLAKAEKIPPDQDSKALTLLEKINEIISQSPNEKVIIFTEYRDTLRFLAGYDREGQHYDGFLEKNGYKGKITQLYGGMSREQRLKAEKYFNSKEIRLLIATDAASEGLNLQKNCHIIIHNEFPWNPNRLEQRNGRIDRWGQSKDVEIFNLHLVDTFESEILEILKEKMRKIFDELGSASDVMGMTSGLDIDSIMMNTSGLKKEVVKGKELIDVAEKEIDKQLQQRRSLLESWQGQTLLKSSGFKKKERYRVNSFIEQTKKTLPGFEDIEEFVKSAIKREGDQIVPLQSKGIYRIEVPHCFRRIGVKESYQKATFSREIAVEDITKEIEFLSPGHALVQSIIQTIRASLHNPDNGDRITFKVMDDSLDKGILFTFVSGFSNEIGEVIEESLFPVFISLSGNLSYDIEQDMEIYRSEFLPVNVPFNFLEKHYKPIWEKLLEIAKIEAANRMNQKKEELENQQKEKAKKLKEDLEKWRLGRSEYLAKLIKKQVESEHKQLELIFDERERKNQELQLLRQKRKLEEELAHIELEVRDRKAKIDNSIFIKTPETPENIGALLIIPRKEIEVFRSG